MIEKRGRIDLDYLRPYSTFIYPLYSEDGKIVLKERVPLSPEKMESIRKELGNIVYYHDSDHLYPVSVYKMKAALNEVHDTMDEISRTEKLSRDTYRKCEHVIEEIIQDLSISNVDALKLLKELKDHDDYIYNHSVNVGILSAVFALKKGTMNMEEIKNVALGGYLIDIGLVKLDRQLLIKEGKYTISEMQRMKRHPQLSYELLKSLPRIHPVVMQAVLFHHEKSNGRGYYQLPYVHLPVAPKIISLCDIYDALTSDRPYRNAISPLAALRSILNSIDNHFDYDLVSDFINLVGPSLNNTQAFYARKDLCELSTREIGVIRDFGIRDYLKPKVMVFCRFEREDEGLRVRFYEEPIEMDLSAEGSPVLTKIIDNPDQVDAIKNRLQSRDGLSAYI